MLLKLISVQFELRTKKSRLKQIRFVPTNFVIIFVVTNKLQIILVSITHVYKIKKPYPVK